MEYFPHRQQTERLGLEMSLPDSFPVSAVSDLLPLAMFRTTFVDDHPLALMDQCVQRLEWY